LTRVSIRFARSDFLSTDRRIKPGDDGSGEHGHTNAVHQPNRKILQAANLDLRERPNSRKPIWTLSVG
jgi:hypothetical protein